MVSFKVLCAAWLAASVSATPVLIPHQPISPSRTRRSFGSLNNESCAWDPQTTNAWVDSGATNMMLDWFANHNDGQQTNWLAGMDKEYHIQTGFSDLDCNTITTQACNAPDSACKDWPHQPYYYIRVLAANVVSLFQSIHETLQDETIVNLGNIGQMVQDFKGDVPDATQLQLLFGNLASGAGIFATFAGLVETVPIAGTIFSLLGSAMFVAARYTTSPTVPDYDAIEAKVSQYAVDIFKNADTYMTNLLPAMWGNGNETMLDELWDTMVEGGYQQTGDSFTFSINKILVDGALMVPVEKSAIAAAVTQSIKDFGVSVLGNIMAALHYFVLAIPDLNEQVCTMTYGAQYLTDLTGDWYTRACFYFLQLPVGADKAITVTQDYIDKAQGYGMNMVNMYLNVRECSNGGVDSRSQAPFMASDTNAYPHCYFGIPYVVGSGLSWPLAATGGSAPDWITTIDGMVDGWNDARANYCELFKDEHYPVCNQD